MTKKTKIALVIASVAVLALVYWYFFSTPSVSMPPAPTATDPLSGKPAYAKDDFPLTVGMAGDNVLRLQRALNWIKPGNRLMEDGIFGNATKTALLLTVNTSLSMLPLSQSRYNEIIKIGNQAKLA